MTNESRALVERIVQKKQMEFPVAMIKATEDQLWAVTGFPTSFLIDVDGAILWKGHPGVFEVEFGRQRLEKYLAQTISLPALPDRQRKSVARLLARKAYGKAHATISRALQRDPDDEALREFVEALQAIVSRKLQTASELQQQGEYGRAMILYRELTGTFAGIPGADAAKKSMARLQRDKRARRELAAATQWAQAMEHWRKGDFDRALKSLRSLTKKYSGTPSAVRADEVLYRHAD